MICNCYFFGRQLIAAAPPAGTLVETHGNQCALVVTARAPCKLPEPDWTVCPFKSDRDKKGAAEAVLWMPVVDLSGHGTTVCAVVEPEAASGYEFEAAGVKFRLTLQITKAEFRHTYGIMKLQGGLEKPNSLHGRGDEFGQFTHVTHGVEPGPEYTSFWRAQRLTP